MVGNTPDGTARSQALLRAGGTHTARLSHRNIEPVQVPQKAWRSDRERGPVSMPALVVKTVQPVKAAFGEFAESRAPRRGKIGPTKSWRAMRCCRICSLSKAAPEISRIWERLDPVEDVR